MDAELQTAMRALPAVEAVLNDPAAAPLMAAHGRARLAAAVRDSLAATREAMRRAGQPPRAVSPAAVLAQAAAALAAADRPRLDRAVNATGILLHTGLGRAILPETARAAMARAAGCCNLQQNLHTGQRDRREECLLPLVRELTGAESALVVNNNAGATLLLLAALARGREAVVSRGELIEIGGSFRLPDIMAESGAVLREVGTTNKTHPADYERAVGPRTALLLKAHKSNYAIVGFTREVSIGEIARIGQARGVPTADDLGCGALVPLERYGLPHEPTVQESLAAGADLVLFSTDKLIGGPQGGMIVGRAALLDRLAVHPLYRALRVGKLTLAALEATLRLFRDPERLAARHPLYGMLARPAADLAAQANGLLADLQRRCPDWELAAVPGTARLGGGALPQTELPSVCLRIRAPGIAADRLALAFRTAPVPVVPRVAGDALLLDMRTVLPDELPDLLAAAETARAGGVPP